MRVACVVAIRGRVQHNRIKYLSQILPDHKFDVFLPSDKIKPSRYDSIYYSSFGLFVKKPLKHFNVCGSITSHKCLNNIKSTLKILENFRSVSVNNMFLYKTFSKYRDVLYIPNGVDTSLFCTKQKIYNNANIKLGWAGNIDRAAKNFTLIKSLSKLSGYKWHIIKTSKSKKPKCNLKNMVNFYHSIDFYVICSFTEGTPNPGLEAASCGIPLISSRVGNMPEIIIEGKTGFLIKDNSKYNFISCLSKLKKINSDKYQKMSLLISNNIKSKWDWKFRSPDFFKLLFSDK